MTKHRLVVNGKQLETSFNPNDSLLSVLRSVGFLGVKHGCETGECGACTILLDGKPVNSCLLLASQAEGHQIETIEGVGEHPDHGWKKTGGLHPIQLAFIETGAIQCGYCTPGQVLAAKALLSTNINPTEAEVREALSGVLCRCTGYVKPVQAVLKAAAYMRGELRLPEVNEIPSGDLANHREVFNLYQPEKGSSKTGTALETLVQPKVITTTQSKAFRTVGHSEVKVDAVKLVQGKPAYTADVELRGMLIGKILHSPVAHAEIKQIDVSKARELAGVAAVLTWQDIPRVVY